MRVSASRSNAVVTRPDLLTSQTAGSSSAKKTGFERSVVGAHSLTACCSWPFASTLR